MLVIRLAKTLMSAALAAFALLVAYDNTVDHGANYEFVRHVRSMDTTFPDSTLKDRAITNPNLWRAAYATIIAAEALTALLLTIGAVALVRRLGAPAEAFNRAKGCSGRRPDGRLFSAFWSSAANISPCSNRLPLHHELILGVLIFLALPDRDK